MASRGHYYEAHEAEYARRLGAGHVGWDAGEYDDFFMRPFVTRSLERAGFQQTGLSALDLGCGTGALSCLLAEAGFEVLGLDISRSAIAFAREMAFRRGLSIAFDVADVCVLPLEANRFNLIVDGHLLHCIVFEKERRDLLVKLRRCLRPKGELWIETMLQWPGCPLDPNWNVDERGVVWSPVRDGSGYHEAVWRGNRWWLPQRLIARSQTDLLAELTRAGLAAIESELYAPMGPRAPGGFRARCIAADDG